MGKELNTVETLEIIQNNAPELVALNELTLALIGGGEMAVSL